MSTPPPPPPAKPPVRLVFTTGSPDETIALGIKLAAALRPGDTLLLEGDLGAGKTHFIRGLARGLHLDESQVCSPTFVLMNVYRAIGAPSLIHLDAYRLHGGDDLDAIGFDAATSRPSIVAIEWPSRLGERLAAFDPSRTIALQLTHVGEDLRLLTLDVPRAIVDRPALAPLVARSERPTGPTTCPITGQPVPPDSPTWPFATEQARLADLHRWLTGGYAVSRDATPDDEEE
ncbi:MAG: tRNA (adenosine(37)-N6)-threonylcarbamoyltransferase complex ATPase subunit type 1 TsaE [Phycisphaerales bacterium]